MAFEPKVAIVTGASRGIGRATALALASRGIAVALASRDRAALARMESEIEARGGRAVVVPADMADEEQVDRMVEETSSRLGAVDLLVNNAGVVARRAIVETESALWDRVLDVNLRGAFLASRAVLRTMVPRRRGRIVNVSSISGTLGTPLLSAYCASKWGLIGFTKAAAEELRYSGIQVFCVCPGSVNTAMLKEGLPGAKPDMEPEDVASTILFLSTEAPRAMTGASIDLFG